LVVTVREIGVADLRRRGEDAGVVLDVRSPEEFTDGHVPGAVNVPLDELPAVAHRYAGREVVAVCKSGGRSAVAAQILAAAGAQVWSLSGGTRGWAKAGHPIERGTTR
jgi:rhodanese-related sulfurtransferase